ncbi:peptidoglycan DD-metalloendopeptidase family protein [Paenalcaligenes sp. Me131]|uniref:peptidoglycan DD-metalloendopeptidase family protein n=1 Tax=Paenalcaligenes sp. Me131 TaxID=3392636 RepID=UPI003D2C4929
MSGRTSVLRWVLYGAVAVTLAACGSTSGTKDGYYVVKRGDTLSKVARQHNQSLSSLMRMNNISNPNRITVGQRLRVQGGSAAPAATAASSGATGSAGSSTALPPRNASTNSVAAPRNINLIWPAAGTSKRGVSAAHSQGVYISNTAGTPVKAAAAGKVIYSGDGLRGYGNLLIVNHANNFLTVYAHNRRLLVSEGATVSQGQTIAEMGNSGTSQVQLYFELRYNGKPVDALRYLPKK